MIAPGHGDRTDPELLECAPVRECDIGVDEWRAHPPAQRLALCCGQLRTERRNDPVVAGQDAAARPDPPCVAAAHVGHRDFLAVPGRACMVLHVDDGAVQADACRVLGKVQACVVEGRRNHILHAVPGGNARDQPADDQPRDGCHAVGKVMDVGGAFEHFLRLLARDRHARKRRIQECGCGGGLFDVGYGVRGQPRQCREDLWLGYAQVALQEVRVGNARQIGVARFQSHVLELRRPVREEPQHLQPSRR